MSDINPKNYNGASVVIVGKAGGPAEVKTFPNGGSSTQLSIAVSKGYKNNSTQEWVDQGTDWYTLSATEDYAAQNWPDVGAGDTVRVDDARLEFRAYTKNNGDPGVEAGLRYGTLVVIERKGDRAPAQSNNSDVTPF